MRKLKYVLGLFFSFQVAFYSYSQNVHYGDSIRKLDSLGVYELAIDFGQEALGNIKDKTSSDAAWAYYFVGVGYIMEASRQGNYNNIDSIKYYAQRSLKIISNIQSTQILNSKNNFLLAGYNFIKGKYDLSILYYKITIDECKKINFHHTIFLSAYKQIGTINGLLGNSDSSYFYFQQALSINKKYFKSEKDEADIYYQTSLITGLKFEKKIDAALKARDVYGKLYGKYSYQVTKINQSIGNIYSANREYRNALSYFILNTKIYDSLPGIYPENIIQNDLNIIRNYSYVLKLDSAEYFIDNSIRRFRDSNCKDSLLLGQLFFERGNNKKDKRYYLESITAYKNAENVFLTLKDSNYLSFAYSQMGYVYTQLADFKNARESYLNQLKFDTKLFGYYSTEVASAHGSLGLLFQTTGEYKNAMEEYLLEKVIYDKLYPELSFEQADISQSLGMAEFGLQNWDKALEYYSKSLDIFKKMGLGKGIDCALLYGNISLYYNRIGDFQKCIYYEEKICEIYKEVYGIKSSQVASTYNSIGSLSLSLSRFDDSKKYYDYALDILQNSSGENIIDLAKTYEGFGNIYEKLSSLDSSEYYFLKALKIYQSVYPDGNHSVISSYDELANLYWKKDNKKLALETKMKSLQLTKQIYGGETERTANVYMELPLYISNVDSSIAYLSKAENILYKINPNHEYLGECYELIGEKYFEKEDRSKAHDYQMKGLKMSIDAYGEKSWQVASKYARIATLYQNANMYKPSIENFNKAIEVMIEAKGKNSEDVGDLYGYLSQTYQQLAQYETALNYLDKKGSILKSIYDATHIAWADLNSAYASIYSQIGQYRKSIEYDRKGFMIAKNYYNNQSPKLIEFLNDIANSYMAIGRSDTAIYIYNQSLDFLKMIKYEYSFEGASVHNNIGSVYLSFNTQDAKTHFLKSVEILRHIRKQFSAGSELYYGNLSIAYNDLYTSTFSKTDGLLSIAYSDTALMIANTSYPEGHIALAPIFRIAGYNFESVSSYKFANEYYSKALNLFIQKFDSLNRDVIVTLFFLGRTKLRENKYDSAEIYFSKSLSLIHKISNGEIETMPLALVLHNKALAEIMDKKYNEAWLTCSEAIAKKKDDWERLIIIMSDKDREKYFSEIKASINFLGYLALINNSNLPYISQELYNNSIFQKGILLEKTKTNQAILASAKDTTIVQNVSKLSGEKKKLNKLYELSQGQRKENKINIDSLEENIRDLERKLSFAIHRSKENISWKEIQKKLLPNESVVDILHFNKIAKAKIWENSPIETPCVIDSTFYIALIITAETTDKPQLVFLRNGKELDSAYYFHYQQFMTNPKQRLDKDWESYQYFWSAIDSVIGDKKVVYVSPDGVYNKINLETLILPDGNFLSDTKDIRIIGSSKELLERAKPYTKKTKDALLVGNPDFKSNSTLAEKNIPLLASTQTISDAYKYTTRSFEGADVSSLPAAEKEVNIITDLLKKYNYQTTTLTGKAAQESSVKSISSPSILHIATHGFFEKDIKPTSNDISLGVNQNKSIENPMLRSGLLLAGAENTIRGKYNPKDGAENGILTAYEVQQMNLDSTELVVLSACETGLGEVKNGEGVYGLQRAFRIAGAKSIIMSLWKVDDQATQIFMTSFYESWLSGKTKREAFKAAQEVLKKSPRYSHPYYWGAFVMIGE